MAHFIRGSVLPGFAAVCNASFFTSYPNKVVTASSEQLKCHARWFVAQTSGETASGAVLEKGQAL